MKKLLIIPWIITAFWGTIGSPIFVKYIWDTLLMPEWIKMSTIPILIILFIGIPILSTLLHSMWWDWMFDQVDGTYHDCWDEGQ